MMTLRSRSKTTTATLRAALKRKSTVPVASTASEDDTFDLSEAVLPELHRTKLQKVAMSHKVRANMKTNDIIQQLLNIQKKRPAEDDQEEGPSQKRSKREVPSEEISTTLTPKNQETAKRFSGDGEIGIRSNATAVSSAKDPQVPEAGPSVSLSIPQENEAPTALCYNEDHFSRTESAVTEVDQPDFGTPVSSRVGTPLLANPNDLRRTVKMMQGISEKDQAMLKVVIEMDGTAERLRTRAREVWDLAKAERGRRERMETYFRYWQETQPRWDRRWVYGERLMSDHEMRLQELDTTAGPPTVSAHQRDQEPQGSDERIQVATPRPMLSQKGLDRTSFRNKKPSDNNSKRSTDGKSYVKAPPPKGRVRGVVQDLDDFPSVEDASELLPSFDDGAIPFP